ncbi:MAG: DNA-directed RNA polymerase subunit omega [Candidatus Omnitrophica bacterium]|nr:DNA-directed RNA polymerase subunit omega [Candidatus Omnitrophota bacterium]
MEYVALEKLLSKKEDSVYKLVNLAAQRAFEIAEGKPRLVEVNPNMKPSTVACFEIAAGKVYWKKLPH